VSLSDDEERILTGRSDLHPMSRMVGEGKSKGVVCQGQDEALEVFGLINNQ